MTQQVMTKMVTLKHKNHILAFMVLVLFVFLNTSGQESNTQYFMKGVPQSYQINPAIQPGCNSFIGIPSLSPFQFYYENSAFSINDILFPLGDSLVTFLHPEASKDDFLGTLSSVNTIQVCASTNLISVGFRRGDLYYTFDLAEKYYSRLSYNYDLFDFILTGNKRGDQFDFSNTNVDVTSYLEWATGISRMVNEKLTIGSRVKLLFGQVNVSTNNKDLSLLTDEDWTLNSNIDIHFNVPGLHFPLDENSEFTPGLGTTEILSEYVDVGESGEFLFGDSSGVNMEKPNPVDLVQFAFGSIGLGLDLGMYYALTDKLAFSASLIDLAGIRWSADPYTIRLDASYVYSGIEYDPSDSIEMTENFLDSLSSVFKLKVNTDPYYTMLPVKLFVGGSYQIIDQISIGILSRTEYYKERLREQLTLSANFSPFKVLAVSFSYTIMNNTYNNIGFGLSTRLGPFNLYFMSDNIPTSYATDRSSNIIIPYRARVLNFRFGLNLVFGCNKARKDLRDLPLVY